MSATFWIGTIRAMIEIDPAKADVAQLVKGCGSEQNAPAPVCSVT